MLWLYISLDKETITSQREYQPSDSPSPTHMHFISFIRLTRPIISNQLFPHFVKEVVSIPHGFISTPNMSAPPADQRLKWRKIGPGFLSFKLLLLCLSLPFVLSCQHSGANIVLGIWGYKRKVLSGITEFLLSHGGKRGSARGDCSKFQSGIAMW